MQSPSGMAHQVLFKKIHIFDGKTAQLAGPASVLVHGNRILRISTAPIPVEPGDTEVIDGGGCTLMPGLIDMHWHTMFVRPAHTELLAMDMGYANLVAG